MPGESEFTIRLKVDESGAVTGFARAQDATDRFKRSSEQVGGPAKAMGDALRGIADQGTAVFGSLGPAILSLGATGAALGAAALAAKSSMTAFQDLALQVRELSYLSGGSAQQISGLLDVLDDFGVKAETVDRAMVFLSRAIQSGSPALDQLKLSIRDSTGHLKSAHDMFYQVIDALKNTRSETERNTLAQELFSRGWTQMVPIIERGSAALKEAAANSKLTMTPEDLKRADQYREAITQLGDELERLKLALGGPLISAFATLATTLNEALARAREAREVAAVWRAGATTDIRTISKDFSDVGARRGGLAASMMTSRGAPEGETAGEKAAREKREAEARKLAEDRAKLEEDTRKKSLAGWVAYADAIIALDYKAAMIEVELLEATAKAREDSRAEALRNEYESLKAQQAIIAEAQALGIKFYEEDARRFAELEKEAARQAEETGRIHHEEMLQRKADLEAVLALEQQRADLQSQQYEAAWAKMFEQANAVGGEAGKGLGMFAAGMKGITDIEAGEDPYTKEFQRALEHFDAMNEAYRQRRIGEAQINAEYNRLMAANDKMYEQQKVALYQNTAQMGAGAMLALYNLTGQKNKELFIAFKAFRIAETIVNTYSAAVGAYNAMASIPYVGPALGVIAAAAAIAFGMAQVAAIASMQPGGGVATAAAPAGGGGYAYAQPTTDQWKREEPQPRPMEINVHIYGNVVDHDAFARELVKPIQKAIADGQR